MIGRTSTANTLRSKVKVAVVGTTAALALMLCATAAAPPAQADAATLKAYTISSANTPVYGNASLSGNRIGAVYGSDEIKINSFSANKASANVTYPTTRGSKSGWVRTSTFLTRTTGPAYKSKGAFTSYRRPGGATYGKVFANDEVVVLGTNGSWTQYRYPVSGGYKLAWSPTSTVTANTTGTVSNSTVRYPLTNYYVCGNNWGTYYRARAKVGRPYHVGIDIKSRSGDAKIYAAAAGTIARAGWNSSNGNYVVIKHTIGGRTCYSFYAHLSKITRASGNVSTGTQIGVIGNTGSGSAGTHLHFAFANSLKAGSYYGYVPSVNGNKATYGGVTYYNPHYVIANKRLP